MPFTRPSAPKPQFPILENGARSKAVSTRARCPYFMAVWLGFCGRTLFCVSDLRCQALSWLDSGSLAPGVGPEPSGYNPLPWTGAPDTTAGGTPSSGGGRTPLPLCTPPSLAAPKAQGRKPFSPPAPGLGAGDAPCRPNPPRAGLRVAMGTVRLPGRPPPVGPTGGGGAPGAGQLWRPEAWGGAL